MSRRIMNQVTEPLHKLNTLDWHGGKDVRGTRSNVAWRMLRMTPWMGSSSGMRPAAFTHTSPLGKEYAPQLFSQHSSHTFTLHFTLLPADNRKSKPWDPQRWQAWPSLFPPSIKIPWGILQKSVTQSMFPPDAGSHVYIKIKSLMQTLLTDQESQLLVFWMIAKIHNNLKELCTFLLQILKIQTRESLLWVVSTTLLNTSIREQQSPWLFC